jgi:hypothetical protein
VEQFRSFFADSPYKPGRSTLFEHIAAVEAGGSPFAEEETRGRKGTLTEEQQYVLFGAILEEDDEVDLPKMRALAKKFFGVTAVPSTWSRMAKHGQLTFRLVAGRYMPKQMTTETYGDQYYQCIIDLFNSGFFAADPSKIACFDFASNSHRLQRRKTLQGKGTKQKKMAAVRYVYTSTFAICLWLDGVNRTPVLLFTFDPAFDPNGPLAKEVAEWCRRNRIDRSRIYFLRSKKHYCPESKDQTDEFRRLYQNQLLGARVLHDNGNSLKERKASRFEGDCERAVFLPSAPMGSCQCATTVPMLLRRTLGSPSATILTQSGSTR